MCQKILNIAAGKFLPIDRKMPYFLVNVDPMFYLNIPPETAEFEAANWDKKNAQIHNIKADAFEFMERTIIPFNHVSIYRFLEHVSFDRVLYFIYLVSTVIEFDGIVDVIVPNYKTLATMILNDNPFKENFESENILLTTELLNEPSCPHASIWTAERAKYFWELEGRFQLVEIEEKFEFDGRDIYLRFKLKRI